MTKFPATIYCVEVALLVAGGGPGLGEAVAVICSAGAGSGARAGAESVRSRIGLLVELSGKEYWLVLKEDANEPVASVKPDPASAAPAGPDLGAGPRGASIELLGADAMLLKSF